MFKKKIAMIGILFVFCLAGQWLLQGRQASADTSADSPSDDLKTTSKELSNNEKDPLDTDSNSDDLRRQLIRQLITLLVLVALIGLGVWWFARKYSRGVLGGRGKLVAVAETIPIGPRKTVHILQVGTRKILIGSTAESIQFLADVTDAVEIPSGRKEAERGSDG